MISRKVIEHKYVYLYLGDDWEGKGYNDPIKFEYDEEFGDIKFWVPETTSNKKLLGVLMSITRKGRFGRRKTAPEYMPLRSIRITKNMLAAVLEHAKEKEKS